jgi:hypothetical protein
MAGGKIAAFGRQEVAAALAEANNVEVNEK